MARTQRRGARHHWRTARGAGRTGLGAGRAVAHQRCTARHQRRTARHRHHAVAPQRHTVRRPRCAPRDPWRTACHLWPTARHHRRTARHRGRGAGRHGRNRVGVMSIPMASAASPSPEPHELDGPLLLLAAPGDCKTYRPAKRIKHLVEERGVDPAAITAITPLPSAAPPTRPPGLRRRPQPPERLHQGVDGGATPSEVVLRHHPGRGHTLNRQRASGHLAGPGRTRTLSRGSPANNDGPSFTTQTAVERGEYAPACKPRPPGEGCAGTSHGQNRTREIRPSGIVGGPAETWTTVRLLGHGPRKTPKQPSRRLPSCAPQLDPDRHLFPLAQALPGAHVVRNSAIASIAIRLTPRRSATWFSLGRPALTARVRTVRRRRSSPAARPPG